MSLRLPRPATLAGGASLLLALPLAPASAQFGGLIKKAGGAVAGKTVEKTVEKAVDKTVPGADSAHGAGERAGRMSPSATGTSAAIPAPVFSANVVEITPARMDALAAGLKAQFAYVAAHQKDYDTARRDYDAKHKVWEEQQMPAFDARHREWEGQMTAMNTRMNAWTGCMQSAQAGSQAGAMRTANSMAGKSEAELKQLEQRMKELQTRMEAAQKRGDNAAVVAISDTARRLMGITDADVTAAGATRQKQQQCGPMPKEMTDPSLAPKEPQPPAEPRFDGTVADSVEAGADRAGAAAAGLTLPQYGVLRERVAALLLGRVGQSGSAWAFTPAEQDAFKAKRSLVAPYTDLLAGGAISWSYSAPAATQRRAK
jgi:hypothetical protein